MTDEPRRYRAIDADGNPRTFDTVGELAAFIKGNTGSSGCADPVSWVNAHRRAEGLPPLKKPDRWHPRNVNAPKDRPEKRAQADGKRMHAASAGGAADCAPTATQAHAGMMCAPRPADAPDPRAGTRLRLR